MVEELINDVPNLVHFKPEFANRLGPEDPGFVVMVHRPSAAAHAGVAPAVAEHVLVSAITDAGMHELSASDAAQPMNLPPNTSVHFFNGSPEALEDAYGALLRVPWARHAPPARDVAVAYSVWGATPPRFHHVPFLFNG